MLSKLVNPISKRLKLVILDGYPSSPRSKFLQKVRHRTALSSLGMPIYLEKHKRNIFKDVLYMNRCISVRPYTNESSKQSSNSLNPTCYFPYANTNFLRLMSRPNVFYVDKTDYIPKLESAGDKAVLVAPRRFGKSLFLDTLSTYYDISRKHNFQQDFGHLWIGKNPTKLANSFHILRIDFSEVVQKDNYNNFHVSFNETINDAIQNFCVHYGIENFEIDMIATTSFSRICTKMELEGKEMMVIIDECDNIMNAVIGRESFKNRQSEVQQMEDLFDSFFSTLKTCIDGGHVRTFVAGVNPILPTEFTNCTSNFAAHSQFEPQFSNLFGLTIEDIRDGLSKITMPDEYQEALLEYIVSVHDGYRFVPHSKNTLFNPIRIQYILKSIQSLLEHDPSFSLELLLKRLELAEEPHTSTPEASLNVVSSHPLFVKIAANALNLDNIIVSDPLIRHFKFSDMINFDQCGETEVLSWMFYNGALTYDYSPDNSIRLKIPNLLARKEYQQELESSILLGEEAIICFQTAVIDMIENHNIIKLKSCIENYLLNLLKHHDALDEIKQQSIHKILLAALAVFKRPMDRVYSEYKMDRVDCVADQSGPAVDIVYESLGRLSDGRLVFNKRFIFAIKNIPTSCLLGIDKIMTWDEQVEANNMLHKLTQKKLKELKFQPFYPFGNQQPITIQSLIDDTKSLQLVPYVEQMKKDTSRQYECISFVIVRVGLETLITDKL